MKKFLALALCAMMAVAAVATAFAAVPYSVTFDDKAAGALAKDNVLNPIPKGFVIDVAKVGDSTVLRMDRSNYDAAKNSGSDSYVDVVSGNTSTHGIGAQFVMSYDLYIEKYDVVKGADKDSIPKWQVCMVRMAPAAGTQFQHSMSIIGKDLCAYDKVDQPLATLKEKTWYNLAVVTDFTAKTFDLYLNGDLLATDQPWTVADTSATEATQVRFGFNGSGDNSWNASYLVDNLKVYNGDKPENATGKKYGEVPATAAPTTPATPGTAAPTFDVAIVLATVSAVAASGVIISKKRK